MKTTRLPSWLGSLGDVRTEKRGTAGVLKHVEEENMTDRLYKYLGCECSENVRDHVATPTRVFYDQLPYSGSGHKASKFTDHNQKMKTFTSDDIRCRARIMKMMGLKIWILIRPCVCCVCCWGMNGREENAKWNRWWSGNTVYLSKRAGHSGSSDPCADDCERGRPDRWLIGMSHTGRGGTKLGSRFETRSNRYSTSLANPEEKVRDGLAMQMIVTLDGGWSRQGNTQTDDSSVSGLIAQSQLACRDNIGDEFRAPSLATKIPGNYIQ